MTIKVWGTLALTALLANHVAAQETQAKSQVPSVNEEIDFTQPDAMVRLGARYRTSAAPLTSRRATPSVAPTLAADVSAGTFGANQGNGNYIFPGFLGLAGTTYNGGTLNIFSNLIQGQYFGVIISAAHVDSTSNGVYGINSNAVQGSTSALPEVVGGYFGTYRADATKTGLVTNNVGIKIGLSNDSTYGVAATNSVGLQIDGVANVNSTNNYAIRYTDGSLFSVLGNGNVGIGTNAPARPLHIFQNSANGIRIERQSYGAFDLGLTQLMQASTMDFVTSAQAPHTGFVWQTQNSSGAPVNVMGIDSDGNVGIGTLNPANKLYVAGNMALAPSSQLGFVNAGSSVGGANYALQGDATNTVLNAPTNSLYFKSGGITKMIMDAGGNLEIDGGTLTLNAGGNMAIRFFTNAEGGVIYRNGTTGDLTIAPQTNTIFNNGNVGIAKVPTEKLDVDGNIKVSGDVLITGATAGLKFATSSAGGAISRNPTTGDMNFAPQANAIFTTGNVGVGTAPAAKLQVAGDFRVGSNGTNTDLRFFTDAPNVLAGYAGNPVTYSYDQVSSISPVTVPAAGVTTHTALYLKSATAANQGVNQIDLVVDGNINAKYQDVAEWVPAKEQLAPGTVVTIDPLEANHVLATTRAYDTAVAGVISPQPGITLGERGPSKALVATTGRVRVHVTAEQRPVHAGDLLVASDEPGVAMASVPVDLNGIAIHRPGTVIGKALESLQSGHGDILVLLTLQ